MGCRQQLNPLHYNASPYGSFLEIWFVNPLEPQSIVKTICVCAYNSLSVEREGWGKTLSCMSWQK